MATTLDSAWFSAHPGPPWVLSTPGEVYTLSVDVDVPSTLSSGVAASGANYGGGELFKITGKDAFLKDGGHYIRFKGQDIRQDFSFRHESNAESESVSGQVDNELNLPANNEWSTGDENARANPDTGGHNPNTESGTGVTPNQPHGGVTSTGRNRRT